MAGTLESLVEKARLDVAARQVCLRTAGRTIEAMMSVLQLFGVIPFDCRLKLQNVRRS
jgi:hypothetical protein